MSNSPDRSQTRPGRSIFPLTRQEVLIVSIGSAVVFTAIAWLVAVVVRRTPFLAVFEDGQPLPLQLAVGLFAGAVPAGACLFVVLRWPALAGFRRLVQDVLAGVQPTRLDMLVVSVSAGWGEELLFRGTIQPLVGVWLASLLFTAAHGMVDPRSRGKMLFGLYVFTCGVGLGFLAEWAGLPAAMAAHAAFDLTVLLGMHRSKLVGTRRSS